MANEPLVPVVAAVRRKGARYWVCRRTRQGAHGGLAGMWEYPGGKIEPGESPERALEREMLEEFGVDVVVGPLLARIPTSAGGKRYSVAFFAVTFLGEPQLRVHDDARWLTVPELLQQEHLPSGTEFNRRLAARRDDG